MSKNFSLTFTLDNGDCDMKPAKKNIQRHITLTQRDLVTQGTVPEFGVLLLVPYSRLGLDTNASQVSGWILGFPFMKRQYVALDFGMSSDLSAGETLSPRIGLADKNSGPES